MRTSETLSIVVPVYKEERGIAPFLLAIRGVLSRLDVAYEIVFALDPSPDRTEQVILAERETDPRIKLLKFSRRVGQPMATLAGLQYAIGDAVVVIDVDLQDPPEVIAEMLVKWREGYDVVLGQRRTRTGENWVKRLVSHVGYKVINRITDTKIPANTGDFRLMSRRVVDEVNKLKECHGFLRGLVAIVGFRQTSVLFDRPPRASGEAHYNPLVGSLKIGLNGMVCFSSYLLSLSSKMGFLLAGGSFLSGITYAFMKIFGFPFPIGNPTIVILILFMGGVQLISVGILGEYIARIYDEVKCRPKFIVDQAVGFDDQAPIRMFSRKSAAA